MERVSLAERRAVSTQTDSALNNKKFGREQIPHFGVTDVLQLRIGRSDKCKNP